MSAFVASAAVQLSELSGELFMFLVGVIQPAFLALTVMFMVRQGGVVDPTYVVVGSALAGLWSVLLFAGGGVVARERWGGTLEVLESTPTSLFVVIAGKMLGTLLFSVSSAVAAYAVGAVLFGYRLRIADPPAFAFTIALAMFALWSVGMLLAPIAVLWRWAQGLLGGFEYPVYVLSGFLFPVTLLPSNISWLSGALPPYWAATLLHETTSGDPGSFTLAGSLVGLLASSTACLLGAVLFYTHVLRRAREDGSLGLA